MSNDILILAEHLNGKLADITNEMAGQARQLAGALGGQAVAVLLGSGAQALAESIGSDRVLYIDDPALAEFNPEAYARVLAAVVAQRQPRVVMLANSSVGMDLAAGRSSPTSMPCPRKTAASWPLRRSMAARSWPRRCQQARLAWSRVWLAPFDQKRAAPPPRWSASPPRRRSTASKCNSSG